jgi:hypothetical protein
MRNLLFLIFTITLFFSCKKDKLAGIDSIRFSYSNYAWGSNCEHYLLYSDSLMKNTISCDSILRGVLPVFDSTMSIEKFNKAKSLLTEIPEAYWESPDFLSNSFCCADCGWYSVEITRNGLTKSNSWPEIFCEEDDPDKSVKEVMAKVRVLLVELRK